MRAGSRRKDLTNTITVYRYDGSGRSPEFEKIQEISTDPDSFLLLDNGEVYFLEDYSSDEGTLYLYRGGEKIKLDDEVYTIFRYNTVFDSIPRSISG